MDLEKAIIALGSILNGALFLVCVAAAGLVWKDGWPVLLAIAGLGVTDLGYVSQLAGWRFAAGVATVLSWGSGIMAGVILLADHLTLGL